MSEVLMSVKISEPEINKADFRICEKLDDKLKHRANRIADELSKKYYPFDALCWALAEFQIIFEKGNKNFSEKDVIRRFNKIIDSPLSYEDVCQLISRLKVYLEEVKLYP